MAGELIQINNLKDNELEFELVAEGLNSDAIKASFVIESKNLELGFPATKGTDGKWHVKVPPLPMLERTIYPFHVQVVAEGYHFNPLNGSLNVVGSAEVYVQNTKSKLASPIAEQKKPVIKEAAPQPTKMLTTKRREKSIEQIAAELVEANKHKVQNSTKLVETKSAPAPKREVQVETPTEVTPFFPNLVSATEKQEHKGTKDEVARKILSEAGYKVKSRPTKRFSLKD